MYTFEEDQKVWIISSSSITHGKVTGANQKTIFVESDDAKMFIATDKFGVSVDDEKVIIPTYTFSEQDEVEVIGLYAPEYDNSGVITKKDDYWYTVNTLTGLHTEQFSCNYGCLFHPEDAIELVKDFNWKSKNTEWPLSFIVPKQPKKQSKKQTQKGKTMKEKIVDSNKAAALTAGKITFGKAAIKAAQKAIKPTVPMMVRGYIEHPGVGIIIANAFNFAVQSKFPDNKKAVLMAESMMEASMVLTAEHFDLDGMIEDFMDSVKLPAVLAKTQE